MGFSSKPQTGELPRPAKTDQKGEIKMEETPKSTGFRMPAEWEPQAAIWLSWPHNLDTWEDKLEQLEQIYCQIIQTMHTGQRVNVLVKDLEMEKSAMALLNKYRVDLQQVHFFRIPTEDTWIRDYGPTFVKKTDTSGKTQEVAMVRWRFNAWGDKYDDLKRDDRIPEELNKFLNFRMFKPEIFLEGGSIDVNGCGTVLTTTQCLLNPNRNPHLSQSEIEDKLKEFLNVSKVLWLEEGIAGDDTDGHVDDIARFVNPNTVVCAYEDDPQDENYAPLKANYELLQQITDQENHPLKIIKLPMPGPVLAEDEFRLPASYANFYIGNESVAVPIFGHPNDAKALAILEKCFPDRRVVGIRCEDMVYGYGTIHCSSQQQPR
jgi:agmatine deiminase